MSESEAIKRCDMLIHGLSVNNAISEAFNDENKGYVTFEAMSIFAETCKDALEEVEQYRAIGTAEELQKMKADYAEAIIDWRQYKKIGTVERFRELTEKAELEADCCEWKLILGNTFVVAVSHENEVFEQTDMKFCPYCGKRIKIAEVE